jgi:hypothetical protein
MSHRVLKHLAEHEILDVSDISRGSISKNTTSITTADSPYSLIGTDYQLWANTQSGMISIILPTDQVWDGHEVRVADYAGYATSSGNIVISTEGSETINGDASGVTINVDYGAVTLMSDGVNWIIVG